MNHKTVELPKKALPRNVPAVRTVFPTSGSSSGYTHILQSRSGSVDSRSNTQMKSIRQSSLEKSMSCLPAGCRSHAPLPSLAQHQQALFPSTTTNLKQDHSGMMENVEEKNETESIEEEEFIPDKSPNDSVKSSMNAHDVIWHGNEKKCVLQGQSPFDGSKSCILMKNITRDSRPEKCSLTRGDFPPGCGSRARVNDLVGEFTPDKSCNPSIESLATAHVFKWRRNKDHADSQGVGANEAGSESQVKSQTSSRSTTDKECLTKESFLYHHCDIVNKSNRETQIIIKEVEKSVQCPPGASPTMKDRGSKRKSLDRCNIGKDRGSKRNSLDRCNIGNYLEESTPNSSKSLRIVPKSDIGIANPSFSELRNANFTGNDRQDLARERVIATLRLYRDICRELSWEKSKAGKENTCIRRIDYHAAKEVKERRGHVHTALQFIGDVPGVKVRDKFYYRMELVVVGLHRPPQSGIDYMGRHPNILATSVVASRDYTDNLSAPDELVYLGQGGMPGHHKKAEDQKLTHGNLALVNSMKRNKPVRVIRKDRDCTFTYDGLYMVARYQKLRRVNRQMVFEFLMKRIQGQPEIGHQKKKIKVLESS